MVSTTQEDIPRLPWRRTTCLECSIKRSNNRLHSLLLVNKLNFFSTFEIHHHHGKRPKTQEGTTTEVQAQALEEAQKNHYG